MKAKGLKDADQNLQSLQKKTAISCEMLNPFKELATAPQIDEEYLSTLAPLFSVAVGLGLRQAGDRIIPK